MTITSLVCVNIEFLLIRMVLLLGPPGAGKTSFLLSLAGELDDGLRVRTFLVTCIYFKIYILLSMFFITNILYDFFYSEIWEDHLLWT